MAKYFKVEDLSQGETRTFTNEASGTADWIFAFSDSGHAWETSLGPGVGEPTMAMSMGVGSRLMIVDGAVENAQGGDGRDYIDGNSHNNILLGDVDLEDFGKGGGEGGDDTIIGWAGDDWIFGGGGSDNIGGSEGNDILNGGKGGDTLSGESGADIFQFTTKAKGSPFDWIADFSVAEGDSFQLDNTVFKGLKHGDLAGRAFAVNNSGRAMDGNDRIIYDRNSGELYFDIDGRGGHAKVLFAAMATNLNISHKNFDIIHDWTAHTDWL